jgi:hypothetical protein
LCGWGYWSHYRPTHISQKLKGRPMDDIIKKVADAIQDKCRERGFNGCPEPLVHHVALAAIEAYQKALWTPYFDRPHGMAYPERRRTWANSLTSHIMNIVGKYLCRHGEVDGAREASRELFEALYGAGAYIVTDVDRANAGLAVRGPYGLTAEEMKIMELKHERLQSC